MNSQQSYNPIESRRKNITCFSNGQQEEIMKPFCTNADFYISQNLCNNIKGISGNAWVVVID